MSARPHVGQQPKWHELPHRLRRRERLGYMFSIFELSGKKPESVYSFRSRLARLVSLETCNSTHSSLQNVSEFPATSVSFCVLKHLHISECQFCHCPSFNSQVGSLCSPITAEFLLWSSCQRFFQLFGCCPVLAREHHCPVWMWTITSTLVTSRHVKHQSGKNIPYFLHLYTRRTIYRRD